jgi:Predicted acyltransferases
MNKNSGIQGLRAIAAFLVVLQHGIAFGCLAKGVDFTPYLPMGFGQAGVGIFFVISGYVMTLCLPQGAMFMPQRIARIYPVFWVAIAFSGLVLPMIGREWHFGLYSASLLPAASFNNSYEIPYWSLIYEVVFYTVIYALIVVRRTRRQIAILISIWAIVIALVCQLGLHPFPTDHEAMFAGKWILASPANFEFIAGALYGLVGKEILKTANPLTLAIQAVIVFIIAQVLVPLPYYMRYALWGVSFVLVLHLVQGMRVPKFLERAGNQSYGLYLVQSMFCQVGAYFMARIFPGAPLSIFVAVTIGTALGAGLSFGALEFTFHEKVIKPVLRRFSISRKLVNIHPDGPASA